VPLPELDVITLPDLGGPDYPVVDHEPVCVDVAVPAKPCWPLSLTAMYLVRPYAHPTAELGRLRLTWMRIRSLFPIPPSIGVHCPTVRQASGQVIIGPTQTPGLDLGVDQPDEDACRLDFRTVLRLPCFLPSYQTGTVFMDAGSMPPVQIGTVVPIVNQVNCNQTVRFNVNLPDLTGGAITVDAAIGRFRACAPSSKRWSWASTLACDEEDEGGTSFKKGQNVGLIVDLDGSVGSPGQTIGTGGALPGIIVNAGQSTIVCGDLLRMVSVTPGTPPTYGVTRI
jgi:hypothetical protein